MDINRNNTDSIKYIIKFLRRNTMILTKYFLKSGNVSDFGSITFYSQDYMNESNNLTE